MSQRNGQACLMLDYPGGHYQGVVTLLFDADL